MATPVEDIQRFWSEQLRRERERSAKLFNETCVLASVKGYLIAVTSNKNSRHSDEVVAFANELQRHIEETKKRIERELNGQ